MVLTDGSPLRSLAMDLASQSFAVAVGTAGACTVLFAGRRTDVSDDLVEPVGTDAVAVTSDLDCVGAQYIAAGFAEGRVAGFGPGVAQDHDPGQADARPHRGQVVLYAEPAELPHNVDDDGSRTVIQPRLCLGDIDFRLAVVVIDADRDDPVHECVESCAPPHIPRDCS